MDSHNLKRYNNAAELIKQAILHSQYNAMTKANAEQLALYFGIGRYISLNSRKGFWGTGALKFISEKLQTDMPGLKGFSETSLKNMRLFYEAWAMLVNSSDASDELQDVEYVDVTNSSVATDEFNNGKETGLIPNSEFTNSKSAVATANLLNNIETSLLLNSAYASAEFGDAFKKAFLLTPFSHHTHILSKAKTLEEKRFYIVMCAEEHLSYRALQRAIAADEFRHRGSMPNNFSKSLSSVALAQKAVLAFKDEYLLDFINVEEIGIRDWEDIDERVVEQQIVQNIKKFILTFGHDFAFMGNQYRISAMGRDHFIDLLFFNRELSALVAIELKTGPFKTAYLGQLNSYLALLDDYVRKPNENPSIGLVLCKDMDKTYVEYMVRQYDKPMGVATYTTTNDMPERLRRALPDIEELKKLL